MKLPWLPGGGVEISKETALEEAREGAEVAVKDAVQETIDKIVTEMKGLGARDNWYKGRCWQLEAE